MKAMSPGLATLTILMTTVAAVSLPAQDAPRKSILVDVAHGQRFWNDPARMDAGQGDIDRARYLRDQLRETASALGGEVGYVAEELTPARLAECDVLFIHVPTRPYGRDEIHAIADYVDGGGSLFVVLEVDYWSKLEDSNLNEIIGRFGLEYAGPIPGGKSGGYTRAGLVTNERVSIPYHGGRVIRGGTPFCFTDQGDEHAFGVFVDGEDGGRVVAMGDGMVSLYMNAWEDVSDYQCAEFMRDTLEWLLQ
jgi:hypothetical protein